VDPAADSITGFDDAHRPLRVGKAARGGQACHPGADHKHRLGVRSGSVIRRAGGRQPAADQLVVAAKNSRRDIGDTAVSVSQAIGRPY
jgi:hypothetical protein